MELVILHNLIIFFRNFYYIWHRGIKDGSVYGPHIGTWIQLEGLSWSMVNRVQEPRMWKWRKKKKRLLWFARLLTPLISGDSAKKARIKCAAPVVPSFSLQWKSDESTEHYLTQMLLAINWRYWQAGKNSHMLMRVQGRLMQARFIKTHQVFAKEKSLIFFEQSSISDPKFSQPWLIRKTYNITSVVELTTLYTERS